jgi:hypothetical protein
MYRVVAIIMVVLSCSCGSSNLEGDADAVEQGPIDFVVRNLTGAPVYLDWSTMCDNCVTGGRHSDGIWEVFSWWDRYCIDTCENCERNGACMMRCSITATAREVEADGRLVFTWDGTSIVVIDTESPYSPCTRREGLRAGLHRAGVCARDGYVCVGDGCTPVEGGIIPDARPDPDGEEFCATVEFEIPYDGEEVVLELR